MDTNLKVKVVYRNEKQEPVYDKTYGLRDYTDMLRADLLRLVTDVEDLAYLACDNKDKSEWPDDIWAAFCKIKHKLLDKAGDIGRLPENIMSV